MAHMTRKVAVVNKLPQLQNLIKRDPESYHEEFSLQKSHFYSELDIFKLRPTKNSDRFCELVDFMSAVASYYKVENARLPHELLELMETHAATLHPDVRAKLLSGLILLRNRGMLDPLTLIKFCMKLYLVPDKTLRQSLTTYVVNDIKHINSKKISEKVNKGVQSLLHSIVSQTADITAKKSVDIMAQLYRQHVWTDSRTVNALAAATLNESTKVSVCSIRFFLGIEERMLEEEDDEIKDKQKKSRADTRVHQHSKKTAKRIRSQEKAVDHNKRIQNEKKIARTGQPLFPAIMLINDPQTLLEKLFRKLRQSGDRFEVKLLQMNFISRLLGCHELQLLTFYSFVQRYLTSHQRDVTIILTYLIQACHDKVPPEDLMPVVKSIAYHFITDRCTEEQITVGLNAVREIFARVPALLHEPDMDSFVQDLAMYAKKNHKSIMIAANGVVNLVRKIYPGLLKNKDKGRLGKEEAKGGVMPLGFGETEVASGVEGTELLEAYERGEIALDGDDLVWTDGKGPNGDADGWKDVSEDEDVEGGDSETEYLTDEDDEEEPSLIAVAEESKIKPLVEWGEEGEQDSDEESDEYEMMGEESEEESGEESGEEEAENDGWEEVEEGAESSDDEDEEEGDEKEAPLSTEAKAEATKARLESTRLLTQDDFDLLARLKTAYAEKAKDPRFRAIQQKMLKVQSRHSKRKLEDTDSDEEGPSRSYKYNSSNLVPVGRVGSRADVKIETLQALVAGRKESKWEHEGHKGGLTNLEKQRKKNYVMVRKGKKSVAGKLSKSNSASRYENSKKKEVFGRDLRKRRRT